MSVYLSLGSNLGDRSKNIQIAVQMLKETGFNITKTSSLYETSPWGKPEQPDFLNLVLKGETKLSPEELLREIKSIEKSMGRKTLEKWGPRIIDVDILFYKKEILNTPSLQPVRSPHQRRGSRQRRLTSNGLKIPHPQLHKRKFVLIPLKEIAPRFTHPLLKKNAGQMLNDIKDINDNQTVVLYNKE